MREADFNEVRFPRPGKTPREDTAAVMKFYGLPKGFSQTVLNEAQRVAEEGLRNPGKRRDLRRKFIFTCDPVTARDYDDALSLETDRKGNRILGVHIADVSHFVRSGSALDREAYRRSTSVYLCDKVVPMLPEQLCNGVCSLVPNEDRLAFSVFMTFDRNGEMIKREFAKSVICSKARFTYEQVMEVISGGGKLAKRDAKVIREVSELAQQLRQKRFAAGALDLEMPEAEVLLDANGEMSGIVTRPYDESHQMIEECMVAANEAVAKELWTKGIKILARLHESPDPEKLLMLRAELRGLGVKLGNIENQQVFARFLKQIKSHPLYSTISMMVLRSMKRAVYDSTTIGHFGLAKKYYAHFTSPIRRYPDLTLHRQLAAYLDGANAKVPPNLLAKWAEHTSEAEQIATEAERSSIKYKLCEFMEDKVGQVYDGTISGLTEWGMYVEIEPTKVEGMVPLRTIKSDYFAFDEETYTLNGKGTHRRYTLGSKVRIRVVRSSVEQKLIDYELVEDSPITTE